MRCKRLIYEGYNVPSAIRHVTGLGVAGMPIGSPGMEGPNPQPYTVIAFGPRGQRVFSYQ